MAVPFLTSARTVLLIGDEALYIYKVTYTAVKLVDNIPWQTDDFEDVVVGLIRKECGAKPVLILNDMTDQHFKGGQRLPKVGLMDRECPEAQAAGGFSKLSDPRRVTGKGKAVRGWRCEDVRRAVSFCGGACIGAGR
ncbi:MAG: hypothetical protein H6867_09430 [Rhodospirillales bacterium]|nr:hypothetical protein [Rhodospirillales bacterium]